MMTFAIVLASVAFLSHVGTFPLLAVSLVLLAALPSVRLPTLVVHGDRDPIPISSAHTTADALGARLVELMDCGHVPYVEQPAALHAALAEFVAGRPT